MKKHKDISEVYKDALVSCRDIDFDKVIDFCNNNHKCRADFSIKKNMMLLWSYKKVALFYEKKQNYKKAYLFWQKATDLDVGADVRVNIGHKLLLLADKMNLPIEEKAGKIIKITGYIQKAYKDLGNQEGFLRISVLQDKAEKLLKKSKYLH